MLSLALEQDAWENHFLVGGIDEAGRGAWAGPLIAACVIFPPGFSKPAKMRPIIQDSKKMSPKQREAAMIIIQKYALAIGVGRISPKYIDHNNILCSTWQAMRQAIINTGKKLDLCLVDGPFEIPGLKQKQIALIKGDGQIFSIAAASIVAKVSRDRIMKKYDHLFPAYGFRRHVGYGTKFHEQALRAFGPCRLHRRSFQPLKTWLAENKIKVYN